MRDAGGIGRAQMRIGALLDGKWRLETLLGVGGSAAVYAATHRNTKRAAVKILHPELSTHSELVARFLREGYVANKIGHPGTVAVLDDDRAEDGSVYLVMELLDGVSLDRFTRPNEPPMPLCDIIRMMDELLDVLASAHAQGIIHRDIKPANLFLTTEQKLKVLDFGIARLAEPLSDGSATQTGMTIGTPAFMPPEQARGRWSQVDARTDLWAVGATMFSLLTQRRPRAAETPNEELLLAMTAPVPPVTQSAPHVPPEIAQIVDKAVAMDMDSRWQDARSMQVALREAVKQLTQRGADMTLPAPTASAGGAQIPTTITMGDPSSAPLVPRVVVVPPPSAPRAGGATGPAPMFAPAGQPMGASTGPGDALTTGRALLQSAPPPPRSGKGALFVGLGLGLVGLLTLGFAAFRLLGPHHAPATVTIAAPVPPPIAPAAPPPQASDLPPPAKPPTSAVPPPTATPVKPPPLPVTPPPPRPRPRGQGKSDDPFDQRF